MFLTVKNYACLYKQHISCNRLKIYLPLLQFLPNTVVKEMKSRWKDDSDLVTEPVKWLSKLKATDSFLIYR